MRVTIIGIGKVGSALAIELHSNGVEVVNIIGKDEKVIKKISNLTGANYSTTLEYVTRFDSDAIAVCVKDGQLKEVATLLLPYKKYFKDKIVFHVSGALTSGIFHKLTAKSNCGSFHPIQTFNKINSKNNKLFTGICIGIEGGKKSLETLNFLASRLNAETLIVPTDKKELYHIASVIASNFLVCYIDIIRDIMADVTNKNTDVYKIFSPIILNTLRNVKKYSVEDALTGPVSRHDIQTLEAHYNAIEGNKDLKTFYTTMSKKALGITKRKGDMPKKTFEQFLKILSDNK